MTKELNKLKQFEQECKLKCKQVDKEKQLSIDVFEAIQKEFKEWNKRVNLLRRLRKKSN